MIEFFKTQFGFSILLAFIVMNVILLAVAYCIYFERKVSAWIQDRIGPNRAGPWGLLQPLADGLKFILKEDIIPEHVDKPLFVLAPAIIMIVALVGFAVIPWGGQVDLGGAKLIDVQVANPDIGLLYILGVTSLGVYGVVLGGWASNNKYSFYGAMRSTAQMLSYEIPLGLGILVVVLTSGQLRLEQIVRAQIPFTDPQSGAHLWGMWNIFHHPFVFLIVLTCLFAETNRTPFDLAEAEQELVGGYHTEYSAMKFGMFFLAEYAHMITGSAFMAVLFLGGWSLDPIGVGWMQWFHHDTSLLAAVLRMLVMGIKIVIFIFVFMWVRWTLPRFRFDQLMRLAWKGLVPLSLGLTAWTTGLVYFGKPTTWPLTLLGDIVIIAAALLIAARARTPVSGRQESLPAVPVT
ncbi:MAG TPA: NADH-quinone oxidoreductase subunit NuoH [Phycisphaerae bacterium]